MPTPHRTSLPLLPHLQLPPRRQPLQTHLPHLRLLPELRRLLLGHNGVAVAVVFLPLPLGKPNLQAWALSVAAERGASAGCPSFAPLRRVGSKTQPANSGAQQKIGASPLLWYLPKSLPLGKPKLQAWALSVATKRGLQPGAPSFAPLRRVESKLNQQIPGRNKKRRLSVAVAVVFAEVVASG